jgi:hypothetical protein
MWTVTVTTGPNAGFTFNVFGVENINGLVYFLNMIGTGFSVENNGNSAPQPSQGSMKKVLFGEASPEEDNDQGVID